MNLGQFELQIRHPLDHQTIQNMVFDEYEIQTYEIMKLWWLGCCLYSHKCPSPINIGQVVLPKYT